MDSETGMPEAGVLGDKRDEAEADETSRVVVTRPAYGDGLVASPDCTDATTIAILLNRTGGRAFRLFAEAGMVLAVVG